MKNEPQIIKDWTTKAGLRAVILLVHDGSHHCGYVAIPADHPDFGKHYDSVDADVHGGLTYSDGGHKYPAPSDAVVWWLGYDCAHSGDELRGPMAKFRASLPAPYNLSFEADVWRDEAFCIAECEKLAEQLASHKA